MSNYTETFNSVNGDTADATELETQFDAISTAIATKLDSDGSGTMTGALNMGSNKITNLTDPTNAQDAASFNSVGIIQAKIATSTTDESTVSTSYSNTSLTGSITPVYSTSNIVVLVSGYFTAAHIGSGGAIVTRRAEYQIYRSSGTPAELCNAAFGRDKATSDEDPRTSYGSVHLIGTEAPGAGTHTYVLRFATPNSVVRNSFLANTGGQAVMIIAELKA